MLITFEHNLVHPHPVEIKEETLRLGTQTNVGLTQKNAEWKAHVWAPKKAKSFTIINFHHTDYHGMTVNEETGYSRFEVQYFTTKKEGKILVNQNPGPCP